ncbi:MAG: hypothetical protein P4L92_02910 [Rudaea sp.]|nr:hypothetical protein [Rudaea sp.]
MSARTLLFLIASSALGSGVISAAGVQDQAVYFDGGQYTAALQQRAHHWHLLPIQGDDVDVTDHASACASRVHVPHGVWMVSSDATGRPQLVAPSATVLPAGFPQHLELRACSDTSGVAGPDSADTLLVPDVVLDWIRTNVSSVMIDD